MCTAYLSPIDTVLGSILSSIYGRLCDECDLLSEVKVSIGLGVNSLNFDEGDAVVLGTETTLVSKDCPVYVKAYWLSVSRHCYNLLTVVGKISEIYVS